MFFIDYKSRKSIAEQVVDNIRDLIVKGVLEEGSRIPSVREMSTTLTINPNTVMKAYSELEKAGYVYTVSGRGTFVAELKRPDIGDERVQKILNDMRNCLDELFFLGVPPEEILKKAEEMIKERGEEK